MKRGKKLNSEILSVRDFQDGVGGILGEVTPMTKRTGEICTGSFGQELATFELTDFDTGEVKKYWFDGGLKGAFAIAKVKPGDTIFIEHTGETTMDLEDGKKGRVQTYEIYGAEA